ncbi:Scr1 family TA system antitoxin-like transcriptional regulator [Streptomyces gamaensis]|uniref:Scr1 family TA system antitoxin-like transcriptional regulator n=1 Tax=Streptomyces gamaensis TaxID=1763542 RepID=A0ABW0YTN6_9ACTN
MEELGAAICEYRVRKGWTQAELGRAVALSKSAISHFENGSHVPRRDVARRIDAALDARGHIFRLRDELDDNPDADRVSRFLRAAARAVRIRQIASFTSVFLETEEHARLCLTAGLAAYGGDLDDKVHYRRQVRAVLDTPAAPQLSIVFLEGALDLGVGDRAVMRGQLSHMMRQSRRRNVALRLLPRREQNVFSDIGTVTIFEDRRGRTTVHRPSLSGGIYITQPKRTIEYVNLYDHLSQLALDVEESRTLIRKALEEYSPCTPPGSTNQ